MSKPVESIYKDHGVQVLWTKKFKAGYILQKEVVGGCAPYPTTMTVAYNHKGDHIGDSKWAYRLANRYGVRAEKASPKHRICTIGFSEREQKWYGWSHRATYGFGIGSKIKQGDAGYRAVDQIDYARDLVRLFHNPEYHEDTWYELGKLSGLAGVWIHYPYNDRCPNQQLRGAGGSHFHPNPEEWGRGEWTAKTLEDAKEMAIAFAEDVS